MLANRATAVGICAIGLLLLYVVIPTNTETVDYGWMRPQTIPAACAWLLVVLGILHLVFPRGETRIDAREILRIVLFGSISLAAVWGFGRIGFLPSAALFVGLLMVLTGERRPVWILIGAILVPLVIWCAVVLLLDRTLP